MLLLSEMASFSEFPKDRLPQGQSNGGDWSRSVQLASRIPALEQKRISSLCGTQTRNGVWPTQTVVTQAVQAQPPHLFAVR